MMNDDREQQISGDAKSFRIDVMVRNRRRMPKETGNPEAVKIGFRSLLPAVERNFGEGGPLFVCGTCCVREEDEHVVYRVKGAKFGSTMKPEAWMMETSRRRLAIWMPPF